jgi:cytidine deaminase
MPLSQEQIAAVQAARHASGGYIPKELVAQLVASGIPIEQLMLDLIPMAQSYAIPPISNFFVGAVSHGKSGALYFGANYEFPGAALSFCVHGEQAATAEAINFGDGGIDILAISAAPCGYCRQFLYELTTASQLRIVLPNTPPALLTSLLPDAFGPGDLGVTAALMSPQDHHLKLVDPGASPHPPHPLHPTAPTPAGQGTSAINSTHPEPGDPVVAAALKAANASYAPYSSSYAGVALRAGDGTVYSGAVAENAAFNPSMSPLEAAVVSLAINGGKKYADIADAVLVEVAGAVASQVSATKAVLAAMTGVPLRVYAAVPTC